MKHDCELNFKNKNMILISGLDKEDDKINSEIFYNKLIDKNKIDDFLKSKIFHNIEKFSFNSNLKQDNKLDNPNNIQIDTNIDKIRFETIVDENGIEKNILKDNLLIKGNNLLGLHSLSKKMIDSIDVIYIDPPYYFNEKKASNTFTYNSNFKLSTWLTFMKNRLEIAKELLTDDGVIFISMNDDGVFHLKLLCDEIFGINNFLSNITWDKCNAQNDALYFQDNKENILVYKKEKNISLKFKTNEIEKILKINNKSYIKKSGITKGGEDGFLNNSNTLGYTIYFNNKTKDIIAKMDYNKEIAKNSNSYDEIYEPEDVELLSKGYVAIRPPLVNGRIKRWTWGVDTMNKDKELILIKKNTKGTYTINTLKKIDDSLSGQLETIKFNAPKSLIQFSSGLGTTYLNKLFKGKSFTNSKPLELLNYLISLVQKKDCIVLDFFAGSGTTGQAVMDLNKKDGGTRKFIMLEQMDYIKEVTCERLKRSMIKENYEDSFVYMEMFESDLKILKNQIKSIETKEELLEYIEKNNHLFNNIDIDIIKSNKKINDSNCYVINQLIDNHIDYISINQLESYLNENLINLNTFNLNKGL